MTKQSKRGVFLLFFIFFFLVSQLMAHGPILEFISPAQESTVNGKITFQIRAPHVKNKYMHLKITKVGNELPRWEGFMELKNRFYTVKIDVMEWEDGKYHAEGILMGGIYQHPLERDFFIKKEID